MDNLRSFAGKTLQKVKRAAPGGDGYTLDHFSPDATKDYLKTFDKAFGNSNYGIRSFLMTVMRFTAQIGHPILKKNLRKEEVTI